LNNEATIGSSIIFSSNTKFESSSLVLGSKFRGNTASEYAAILTAMRSGHIQFRDVEFSNNVGFTTSVFEMTQNSIDSNSFVTLNNCTFAYNTGVAVISLYEKNSHPRLLMLDSTLRNNTGSCLRALSGVAQIHGSVFLGNHANEGGAMFISGAQVHTYNTTFEENSSDLYGGAVKLRESGFLNCTGCLFLRNYSGKHGGAIELEDLAYFHMYSSSCLYNIATQKGGCICGLSCSETYSKIIDSYIARNHGYISGAVTFVESLIEIQRSTFSENMVDSPLGGDFSATFGMSKIFNSTFENGR
jgi:predicted outer membrane repeat protein